MTRLLCIVCPPLAVLLCLKPISAIFNLFLCAFFWVPGVMHAVMVVEDTFQNRRTRRVTKSVNRVGKQLKGMQATPTRAAAPEPQLISNPHIGTGGTKFKRRK